MKGLKKPSLKGPEVKVPDFLSDVYHDLRERRLLPLVALVVVAIAAVPFLLGEEPEAPVPPAPTAGPETAEAASSRTLTVVQAKPGLRDYRKRLKNRTPTDPFVQRFRGLPPGTELRVTETTSGGGSEGGSVEEEVTVDIDPGDGGGAPPRRGRPGKRPPEGTRFYAYRPSIRFGIAGSGDLTRYRTLEFGQLLPKEKPVIAFLGVSEDGKRVAFDVSPEVATVRGQGRCIGGNQNCGLLLLKAGEAVDLLTGRPNRDFRLAVDKIEFVEVMRSRKAGTSSSRRGANLDLSQSFSK